MRPSPEGTSFGALFRFVMLLVMAVLLPLATLKWMAEALAPGMLDSVSYYAWHSLSSVYAPVREALIGAAFGVVVFAVMMCVVQLLRSVGRAWRRSTSSVRSPKAG